VKYYLNKRPHYGLMGQYSTNIGIKNEVYEKLKEKKKPGQSFSGVILELIQKSEKK
jgi:predicted CopG family antitoxin